MRLVGSLAYANQIQEHYFRKATTPVKVLHHSLLLSVSSLSFGVLDQKGHRRAFFRKCFISPGTLRHTIDRYFNSELLQPHDPAHDTPCSSLKRRELSPRYHIDRHERKRVWGLRSCRSLVKGESCLTLREYPCAILNDGVLQ